MLAVFTMVTCRDCYTEWRQSTLDSVWSLAAAALHPPGTTDTEGYRWQQEANDQKLRATEEEEKGLVKNKGFPSNNKMHTLTNKRLKSDFNSKKKTPLKLEPSSEITFSVSSV